MPINATPHAINVYSEDGLTLLASFPPSGLVLRCAEERHSAGYLPLLTEDEDVLELPLYTSRYGKVYATRDGVDIPVPEPVQGTRYVVSALVRLACPHRTDLLSPGELLRGEDGQPKGCIGLTTN